MLGTDKFAEPFYFSITLSRLKWVICKYLGSTLYWLLLFINNNKKKYVQCYRIRTNLISIANENKSTLPDLSL